MKEDQAKASMFCLLRGWALQAVSDLPLRCWLSETGEVVMSLEQYPDIVEKKLTLGSEDIFNPTDGIRSWGNVIEEKAECENGQAKGRIKHCLSETSKKNFELWEIGLELVRTVCSNQDEATRNFKSVVDLLHLSE